MEYIKDTKTSFYNSWTDWYISNLGTINADYELQVINSYLSSLWSISADKDNRIQTLEKFESKIVNDGEFIALTLSNQYYPKTVDQYLEEHGEDEIAENECLSIIYQIARCLEDLK